jgi:hypothetical protein
MVPTPRDAPRTFGAFDEPLERVTTMTRSLSVRWGASGRRFKSSRPDQIFI